VAESLPHLFRRHEGNVFMTTLRTVLARYFARRIAEHQALKDAAIEKARQKSDGNSGIEA
jgi:hypothetical protein